jgi:zinc protease
MTDETVGRITREDLVRFHADYFRPGRAIVTVAGDVEPGEARRMIERALAGWAAGGSRPSFEYPAPPARGRTTIYLVDKPGAAQSSIVLGHTGPARSTADYDAIRVMNSMFGEQFQSRLNNNIREQKGYSYGVRSMFDFGRGPGAFRALGDVVAAKTDSALIEFLREIRGIRGERPVDADEMDAAKAAIVQSLPERFGSVAGLGNTISGLYVEGLPQDYYQQFTRRIGAVTPGDVVRVARQYIDPDHLVIVIVGDRASIEAPLRALNVGPLVLLDAEGNALPQN